MNRCFLVIVGFALFVHSGILHAQPDKNRTKVTRPPLVDQSLTEQEYEQLGVPVINKVWTFKEYDQATKVIRTLVKTPEKLPRYESPKSGKLFSKFIDLKEYSLAFDEKLSGSERMLVPTQFAETLERLLFAYGTADYPKWSLAVEFVELQEPYYYLLVRSVKEMNRYYRSVERNSSNTDVRETDGKEIQKMMTGKVLGLLLELDNRSRITEKTRQRLASIMQTYLPDLFNEVRAELRADYKRRFLKYVDKENDHQVKDSLQQLATKIK